MTGSGVHRHGAARALHQRVAVRRRIGRDRCGERRAAAGSALDYKRLVVLLLKNLRVSARQQVGAAAGSERHEDDDIVRWIVFRTRLEWHGHQRRQRHHHPPLAHDDVSLSYTPAVLLPRPWCQLTILN